MKKNMNIKKIIVSILIIFMVILSINISYAENEINGNTTEGSVSGTENNTEQPPVQEPVELPKEEPSEDLTQPPVETPNEKPNTTPVETPNNNIIEKPSNNEQPTANIKSNNADLKMLGIEPHDFTGFKSGNTSYEVKVPSDTEVVEVYATAKDKAAEVSGTGKRILKEGNNKIEVVVTAEDGTTKTYTINVIREEAKEEEETENTEDVLSKYSGDGLASLKIGNLELSPKFDTIIYEYKVKYSGEETKLNIETKTTDPYYEVEIIGNDELVEGENVITILVSDPDGKNIATYQIMVNKTLFNEEGLLKEEEARQEEKHKRQLIITGIVVVIIVVIVVFLIIRYKRKQVWAQEYTVPYNGFNEEGNQLEDFDINMNYIKEEDSEFSKENFLNNCNVEFKKEFRRKSEDAKRYK